MKAKKVLMVLMGLEIGGAETHVVELSKELRRRGWDVAVVSNGGVYERELTEAGIRCHRAPLHKRNAALMLRSLHILRRVIRTLSTRTRESRRSSAVSCKNRWASRL